MEISEVRVKLVPHSSERLRAFCSVTLDGNFVIRDLKIIEGVNGPFVAMPSRKLADRCPRCSAKNHLRAKFCNECGAKLRDNRAPKDMQGRAKLHADVAHPINARCRELMQNAVIEAYKAELERSKSPDYEPPSFEDFEDFEGEYEAGEAPAGHPRPEQPARPEVPFSEYNELIDDLRKDAAGRRGPHEQRDEPESPPPIPQGSVVGRPRPQRPEEIEHVQAGAGKADRGPSSSEEDFGAGLA